MNQFENKTVKTVIDKAKTHSRWANSFDTRENAYLDGVKFGSVETTASLIQAIENRIAELEELSEIAETGEEYVIINSKIDENNNLLTLIKS